MRPTLALATMLSLTACKGESGHDVSETDLTTTSDTETGSDTRTEADLPDTSADTHNLDPGTRELSDLHLRGPFEVGYQTVTVQYPRPDNGEIRTLRTAIWYPTEDIGGVEPLYFGVFPREDVWLNAAPADLTELPVLVYSHGNYGFAEASASLVEHLVSHGWFVIAPDHTGNTLSNNGDRRETALYHLRGADLSAALDWLEAIPADHPLAPMPSDRVIAAGHSYGGYTVMTVLGAAFSEERLQGCADDPDAGGDFCAQFDESQRAIFEAGVRDERITAGILLAAGNFGELGPEGVAQIDTPVLQITGGMDDAVRNETNGDPIWAAFPSGDKVRVNLPRGCHQTFAIGCGLPGELETSRGFELVNTYSLAFARRWGEDDRSVDPLLSGELIVDAEEVELSIK